MDLDEDELRATRELHKLNKEKNYVNKDKIKNILDKYIKEYCTETYFAGGNLVAEILEEIKKELTED